MLRTGPWGAHGMDNEDHHNYALHRIYSSPMQNLSFARFYCTYHIWHRLGKILVPHIFCVLLSAKAQFSKTYASSDSPEQENFCFVFVLLKVCVRNGVFIYNVMISSLNILPYTLKESIMPWWILPSVVNRLSQFLCFQPVWVVSYYWLIQHQ